MSPKPDSFINCYQKKEEKKVLTNIDCKSAVLNEYTDLPDPIRHPALSPNVRIETYFLFFFFQS